MSGLAIALVGFALMLGAIFLRVPVAAAMAITGFVGSWVVLGRADPALSQLKSLTFDTFKDYNLSIIPLFLLMGQFATKSGMSRALFVAASDWLGHRRGGIAMASVGACAGFGAVCGSSLATASTMGQVALPEMKRRGYSDSLSTGVLAAGGTLGILIPPSIILVIYAIQAEQNIVKMFVAAAVPGVLAALGYILTVAIYVRVFPDAASTAPRVPLRRRWRSAASVWPVVAIFGLVMGGIAADWNWTQEGVQALFTPTEGAAVGAIATGLYGLWTGGLDRRAFLDSVLATAQATAMIFLIIWAAKLFNAFLAVTRAPDALLAWIDAAGIAPLSVVAVMLLAYLIFGCLMDSLSMILLTIPIFYPIIISLEIVVLGHALSPEEAAIWFGILALIVVEVGLITPPVGLNLFIINGMARDVPMGKTYAGVLPFVLADLVRVVLLLLFPVLSLWLVGVVFP